MKTNKMSAIFSNQDEYNDLRPLTDERSLSTLYFAGKYRLMDFTLSSIVNAGINNVYTLINQEKVRSYFDHLGGGKEWGLDTIGSYEYLDFYQVMMQRQARGEDFFNDIINFLKTDDYPYTAFLGNKMLGNFDLQSILHFHQENNNKITAVFKQVTTADIAPDDQALILDENNSIVARQQVMDAQKQDRYNLCLNVYVVNTDWLIDELKRAQRSGASTNITQLLAGLAAKYRTTAYEYTGYLRNIHDIAGYYQANMDMLNKKQRDSLLYGSQKIITRIRNEVGTYFSGASDVKSSMLSTGCRIEGRVRNSIISRRVKIEKDSDLSDSVVMANCRLKRGSKVAYAILDKNVVVAPNVEVKGTPEKPIVVKKGTTINKNLINN